MKTTYDVIKKKKLKKYSSIIYKILIYVVFINTHYIYIIILLITPVEINLFIPVADRTRKQMYIMVFYISSFDVNNECIIKPDTLTV
jgi:hypothetical protein